MTSSPGEHGVWRSWPVLVLLFFVPAAAWAVANPLFSVPDEPSHVTKAVSIWYGDLSGKVTQPGTGVRTYRLPAFWAPHDPCFARQIDTGPASCPPVLSGSHRVVDVSTPSGAYPPLYFALVGWPGRLFPRAFGVYLMRLVSALLCAVFLAAAVRALLRVLRPGLAVAGVLVAVTPMTWFLAGSVNPSGFEIATAIALWAHVLAVARRSELDVAGVPTSLLVGLFVSGSAMALTRPLSGPFAAAIVILALLSTGWPTLVAMARQRRLQITFVGLAVVCVAAVGMVYATGIATKVVGGSPFPAGADHWTVILGTTPTYVSQMIGTFGWLDTPTSNLTLYVWLGLVFALMAGAVMLSRWRHNIGLALTVAATILIPLFLQAPLTGSTSLVWQGRYTLPIAAGIPLLAILSLDRGAGLVAGLTRRLSVAVAATVAVLNTHALYWDLHRYTVGLDSRSLNILLGAWQPPGGSVLWLAAMAGAGVLGVAIVATAPLGSPLDELDDLEDGRAGGDQGSTSTSAAATVAAVGGVSTFGAG